MQFSLVISEIGRLCQTWYAYPDDKIEYYGYHVKNKTQFQHINELLDDVLWMDFVVEVFNWALKSSKQ